MRDRARALEGRHGEEHAEGFGKPGWGYHVSNMVAELVRAEEDVGVDDWNDREEIHGTDGEEVACVETYDRNKGKGYGKKVDAEVKAKDRGKGYGNKTFKEAHGDSQEGGRYRLEAEKIESKEFEDEIAGG